MSETGPMEIGAGAGVGAISVAIEDVAEARCVLARASHRAQRVAGIGWVLGVLGFVVGVSGIDRITVDPDAGLWVVTVAAIGLVVIGYLAAYWITRNPRAERSAAVDAAAERMLVATRAAGFPDLDPKSVRRALREDDNGPAPWFDPELGPHSWPVWRIGTVDPAESHFVIAERSNDARSFTVRVEPAQPGWWSRD
ncbi:hypothetical protein [Curtobacterium sp. ME-Dv--P-122a]|uniref:hypothetical protein n=1 Tax=Curtobacterium sp. ME-Dv--P-122a TaxID=3040286 RepID=UPI00254FDFCA|nr:hypothetical protein [Curtobacterium sp. ME-Dv--P-122a]